jgi:Uma2 family endonuclease
VAVQKNSATKLTYRDYLRFPDDGLRHEIIEGEHYVTPSPVTRHQRILVTLSHLLQTFLDREPIGEIFFAPFDVLLSEFNVFVPDLIYLSRERAHLLTAKNLQGAPDLAVEILSPGTRSRDLRLKRDVYRCTGVREYWIIDPDGLIDVYRREQEESSEKPLRFGIGESLATPLIPGFVLSLDKMFGSQQ